MASSTTQIAAIQSKPDLKQKAVIAEIATILERHLGVDASQVLAGTAFLDLHSDFDSLTFVEVQLMLEEKYDFEFDRGAMQSLDKLPKNAVELAVIVVEQHNSYKQAIHAKAVAKAIQLTRNTSTI
jgi:acyl carrier protein